MPGLRVAFQMDHGRDRLLGNYQEFPTGHYPYQDPHHHAFQQDLLSTSSYVLIPLRLRRQDHPFR